METEYKVIAVTGLDRFNIKLQEAVGDGWLPCGNHLSTPYKGTMEYSIMLLKAVL